MDNFIRVYQNAFSNELCDRLISKFESTELEDRERHDMGEMHFSQVNFRACGWKQEQDELVNIFLSHTKKYTDDIGITTEFPQKYALEDIRLKKYMPDGYDQFGPHVDVVDKNTSTRFLVFFVYLDDNISGGTHFDRINLTSPCKKGSILIFPPLWTHLHSGLKPIEKPKYIVGSYLHYVAHDK